MTTFPVEKKALLVDALNVAINEYILAARNNPEERRYWTDRAAEVSALANAIVDGTIELTLLWKDK
jgi:hypothetical protein